jgi:hypothetical protein
VYDGFVNIQAVLHISNLECMFFWFTYVCMIGSRCFSKNKINCLIIWFTHYIAFVQVETCIARASLLVITKSNWLQWLAPVEEIARHRFDSSFRQHTVPAIWYNGLQISKAYSLVGYVRSWAHMRHDVSVVEYGLPSFLNAMLAERYWHVCGNINYRLGRSICRA